MRIAIIGGGAAGFFAACRAKLLQPSCQVVLLESGSKVLSKVRISGGGRCNVTHACFDPKELSIYYPRGGKELRQAFSRFMTGDTMAWFEDRGVPLKTESDGRIFPVSDNSASIVNCLLDEARQLGVEVRLNAMVDSLDVLPGGFQLSIRGSNVLQVDRVLIATGGHPKLSGFDWLAKLGHSIIPPVPSLFTFNVPGQRLKDLMGVSVNPVSVTLPDLQLTTQGPLLITHWGFSGPAILKSSSLAARELATCQYTFKVVIDWLNEVTFSNALEQLQGFRKQRTSARVFNGPSFNLPRRLWEFLVHRATIRDGINWSDLRKEELERLANTLTADVYQVAGKTTFKEEFVTCGGISLKEVDFKTMESKVVPGLYFAGEVLDIDAVTGGFNFQAAWTTGYLAGSAMVVDKLSD